jgi:GT2 family glycosyltransferase
LENGSFHEPETEIAVVIVNYGTADLTIAAVDSVRARSHGGRKIELHVVDNASPGNDADRLADAHATRNWGPSVTLWREKTNHGFGRGNNLVFRALAARRTPPRFVFLLNPDAKLENEAIDILADALEADEGAGAAGAGISFPDGSPAVACFRFPTLVRELVTTINFGPLERLLPDGRTSLPPEWHGPVDWVAGASVMMRFDRLAEVGFFDPDFFLYYEEVELMRRLAQAGYRTLYVPEARIVHIAGAATDVASHDKRSRPRPAFVYDSWRLYYLKSHGRAYALTLALLKFPAAWISMALSRLRGDPSILPARFSRDHWRHVVHPLLTGATAE